MRMKVPPTALFMNNKQSYPNSIMKHKENKAKEAEMSVLEQFGFLLISKYMKY